MADAPTEAFFYEYYGLFVKSCGRGYRQNAVYHPGRSAGSRPAAQLAVDPAGVTPVALPASATMPSHHRGLGNSLQIVIEVVNWLHLIPAEGYKLCCGSGADIFVSVVFSTL